MKMHEIIDERTDPDFRRWFAGSKVVDAQGKPLKLFHGTHSDFDHFHPGSHFGTVNAANHRVRYLSRHFPYRDPDGSRLMPVYLRITNPLRVTDIEASDESALHNSIVAGKYPDIDRDVSRQEGAYKAAQQAGYDGLVYKNRVEDRGKLSYVTFDPSQVRSAITLENRLSEMFKNEIPNVSWEKQHDSVGITTYAVTLPSGRKYYVDFDLQEYYGHVFYRITFQLSGHSDAMGITGTGQASNIFAAVFACIKDFLSTGKDIDGFTFSAKVSQPSRMRLYAKLADKLADHLHWQTSSRMSHDGEEQHFYVATGLHTMTESLKLVEDVTPDPDYYMTEGCGIFAYALWIAYGKPADGMMGIISDKFGERWSRSIPFEITHVFFKIKNATIDARGIRSVADMAKEIFLEDDPSYNYEGCYPPETFRRKFMGASDRFPLYGGRKEIQEALALIRQQPALYGLSVRLDTDEKH